MTNWVSAEDGFIAADVIRWKESAYERRGRRGRSVKVGERRVVAEVLQMDEQDGWVHLLVLHVETLSEVQGRAIRTALPAGAKTKRKKKTIARGKPERLLWSDESARAVIVSKFLVRP